MRAGVAGRAGVEWKALRRDEW